MQDDWQCDEKIEKLLMEFLDTQMDNQQVCSRWRGQDVQVWGGAMDVEEWEDVARECIELLAPLYTNPYRIWGSSKNGFTLVDYPEQS